MEVSLKTGAILEQVQFLEGSVDEQARTVGVTLVQAGWSLNGRFYPGKVLEQASQLWEGARAYYNHDVWDSKVRDVQEMFGHYQGLTFQEAKGSGSIHGTLHVFEGEDKAWSLIKASVGSSKPVVALSITGIAQWKEGKAEGRDGDICEQILEAHSCDMVTHAAAGGSFDQVFTQSAENDLTSSLVKHITKKQVESERPDLIKAWKKEWKTPSKGDQDNMGVSAEQMKEIMEASVEKTAEAIARAVKEGVEPIAVAVKEQGSTLHVLTKDLTEREVKQWATDALAKRGIPEKLRESALPNMLMTAEGISEDTPEKTAESIKSSFAEYAKNTKTQFEAAGVTLEATGDGKSVENDVRNKDGNLDESSDPLGLGQIPSKPGESPETYAERLAEAEAKKS